MRWAAGTVAARPGERSPKVGCGRGVVVGLVAATLTTGRITGLDRSAKMIDAARRANAVHIAAAAGFATVFAVGVAAFWTHPAVVLPVARWLLAPHGLLLFVAASAADRTLQQVRAGLDQQGLRIDDVITGEGTCVVARKA